MGYICDNVLPVLNQLARPSPDVNPELEILRLFAEISEFCGELDKAEERMEKLFNRLTVSTVVVISYAVFQFSLFLFFDHLM